MMERGHAEEALARELEVADLDDDGGGLDHVEPADEREEQLRLGQHGEGPDGPAKSARAHDAHASLRSSAAQCEKAQGSTNAGAAEARQISRALDYHDHN